jgi:hypothetical protein
MTVATCCQKNHEADENEGGDQAAAPPAIILHDSFKLFDTSLERFLGHSISSSTSVFKPGSESRFKVGIFPSRAGDLQTPVCWRARAIGPTLNINPTKKEATRGGPPREKSINSRKRSRN